MSLFNFSGEGVNYNPVRGLVRELRAEANKGEEEEEERVQAEQEVTGKGISRMDGEEMEERTRENQKDSAGKGNEHHEPGVGGGTERAWEQMLLRLSVTPLI